MRKGCRLSPRLWHTTYLRAWTRLAQGFLVKSFVEERLYKLTQMF
jgi:hypothetical protein